MSGIPISYLKNMGDYSIRVHSDTVTVKTADSDVWNLIESRISDFHTHLNSSDVKVVGVDVIQKKTEEIRRHYLFVLYTNKHCLVIHMDNNDDLHISVRKFMKDSSIYFVGPAKLYDRRYGDGILVDVGDLAARALKKPSLTTATLANIAREVGVEYDGPENGTKNELEVDSKNSMVLTDEMMKSAINDAVAHYNIGCKLLKSTFN